MGAAILLAALALAFLAMLHVWVRQSPSRGALWVWLVDADDGAPVEVCLADALRALEPVAPHVCRVTVAAAPARSAMLAALSRRQTGISVAAAADGGPAGLQQPVLVAGLGRDFRGRALLAGARRVLSMPGGLSTKRE